MYVRNKLQWNIPIASGEELLVWYGDEYARELGLIRDKNLLFRPKYVNGEGLLLVFIGYRDIN